MSRRYAVIGTGAVGGFYGARLQQAGFEVHFLLHSDYEHVREYGLRVESQNRILTLGRINAYKSAAEMPPCDVVIVALKTTHNHLLPTLLAGPLAPEGVVLMLQNGLGVEADAAAVVGPDRVIGGLCFICVNKIAPGSILHLDYGDVVLGEYRPDGKPGGVTPRLEAIAGDFQAAQVRAMCTEDLLRARWKKLVWNIPFNALSVILRSTTDRLMLNPSSRELIESLMMEVADCAAACGKQIDRAFVQKMLDDTDRMKPYKTSMMIDYERGRPMEIETIYERPLAAAQAAGRSAPQIQTILRQLRFLDSVRP
ncbi:MAG: putative 2-dehydropantoate 2-reductase [Kiritimatiellae bacterium]|nr:putative 2-dehydropantoate 2-reductase [Kiritimatiellia bacterium]MDW8458991.1 putative 2-dehydropantoate 2-reductase [Verrucomicrobiota bacterium]